MTLLSHGNRHDLRHPDQLAASPLEWVAAAVMILLGTFLAHVAMSHAGMLDASGPPVSDLLALQAPFDAAADRPMANSSAALSYFVALAWIGTSGLLLLVAALVTFFPGHYRASGRRLAGTGLVMALLLAAVAQLPGSQSAWAGGVRQAAGTGLAEVDLPSSADWVDAVNAAGYVPIGALALVGLVLVRLAALRYDRRSAAAP